MINTWVYQIELFECNNNIIMLQFNSILMKVEEHLTEVGWMIMLPQAEHQLLQLSKINIL